MLVIIASPRWPPSQVRYEYRWADGVKIKRPIEVSAPKYVKYLMDWIEIGQLDDEFTFPQNLVQNCDANRGSFPPNFCEVIRTIFKRLFRVYAQIYHSHFQMIVKLKEEAHLDTCSKHFKWLTWAVTELIFGISRKLHSEQRHHVGHWAAGYVERQLSKVQAQHESSRNRWLKSPPYRGSSVLAFFACFLPLGSKMRCI